MDLSWDPGSATPLCAFGGRLRTALERLFAPAAVHSVYPAEDLRDPWRMSSLP